MSESNEAVWLDNPDRPGWWMFKGNRWQVKRVYSKDGKEADWGEWDEGDEPTVRMFDTVSGPGESYHSPLFVRYVTQGETWESRDSYGPYKGESALGFVETNHPWKFCLTSLDCLIGKWTYINLPLGDES